jgi:hypothetical protein
MRESSLVDLPHVICFGNVPRKPNILPGKHNGKLCPLARLVYTKLSPQFLLDQFSSSSFLLKPGQVSHSFIWSPSSSVPTTFDPVASFVSVVNLHCNCPPSLLKALADSQPDRDLWLASFFEEKHGIQSLDMNKKITFGKYQALHEKSALKQFQQCAS